MLFMIVMILLLMNCILVDDIIFNNDAEVDYCFVLLLLLLLLFSVHSRAVGPSGFTVIVEFANLVYCRVNGYAWWAVVLGGMEDDRMRGCAAGWIRRR